MAVHEHERVKPDLDKIRKAGAIAAEARDHGATLLQEGRRLLDIAEELEELIRKKGAEPGFPVNISLNNDAAHYTPVIDDPRKLQAGDLVKLDLGAHIEGHLGDTAVTVEVGTSRHARMIEASREAVNTAIGAVKDGLPLQQVGKLIDDTIRGYGYKPISNLTGHSIEVFELHAGVSVPNIPKGQGNLHDGMVIAIEPFATDGVGHIKEAEPGNIWHFMGAKPQRNPHAKKLLDYIEEHHGELPWAERWLVGSGVDKKWIPFALRLLNRAGCVSPYAVLREAGDGMVTQAEHTLIVHADKGEVTTAGKLWPPKAA